MKYNEILNLSEVLGEGFFADKVVSLLSERRALGPNDKKLLGEILHFVKKVRKGERQVKSGRLSRDALDSIGAYHRAISIITFQSISDGSGKTIKKNFSVMLETIASEVREAIERELVGPSYLKQTIRFFDSVRHETLNEASSYYSKKVEVVPWPSLLY